MRRAMCDLAPASFEFHIAPPAGPNPNGMRGSRCLGYFLRHVGLIGRMGSVRKVSADDAKATRDAPGIGERLRCSRLWLARQQGKGSSAICDGAPSGRSMGAYPLEIPAAQNQGGRPALASEPRVSSAPQQTLIFPNLLATEIEGIFSVGCHSGSRIL